MPTAAGVVNINGIGFFLGDNDNSTETIVRHIDHVASLVGPQHVGLGLDFVFDASELDDAVENQSGNVSAGERLSKGVAHGGAERIPRIAERLLQRGWDDSAVCGLLGANNLRVAKQVWR